jgi:hypothetical protein
MVIVEKVVIATVLSACLILVQVLVLMEEIAEKGADVMVISVYLVLL